MGKPVISAIVAMADNGVISNEGKIPWHLPADFARLKEVTMGHPIIMGRGTHDYIGRTLPGRTNIVISRNPSYKVAEGSILVHSLDEALALPEVKNANEAFIFGGASIYSQAMPVTQKLYLTKVHTEVPGDIFFKYQPDDWQEVSCEKHSADKDNPFDWEWCVLKRRGG